jgi:predicted dehydrogenase
MPQVIDPDLPEVENINATTDTQKSTKTLRIGVIGAGLIGKERLDAVQKLAARGHNIQIAGVYDANPELTDKAALAYDTKAYSSLDALLATSLDLTTIALPHDITVPVALKVLEGPGKVLVEKPMGRDLKEARLLFAHSGKRLHVGLNYRFYPGIRQAIQDMKAGRFGKIISVELHLGHGCSPGQDKTWKLQDDRAGGGALIDPGIHLLDLCTVMAPEGLEVRGGSSWSGYWNTGIEEEVNLVLQADKFAINVHVSIVHWRSEFRMTIRGTDGYGIVTGRNRSYGPQQYLVGPRWGWQNAPSQLASEQVVLESDGMDVFADEMQSMLFPSLECKTAEPASATANDALHVMELLHAIREKLGLRNSYSSN